MTVLILKIEEAGLICVAWQGAGFGAAEDAITVPDYRGVDCVSEGIGD
jgi:hypothetical protein